MAFFPGAARKTNMEKMGAPSPCQYNPSLSHSRSYAMAPFGSTTKLNRSLTFQKQIPQQAPKLQDNFYSIANFDAKIKPEQQVSSMFKSATHRFKSIFQEQPGPGQYNINRKLNQSKPLLSLTHYQPSVKQTVPSIPVDNLGFRQNQKNQMKKVIPSQQQTTDFTYNPESSLNPKGVTTWKQTNQISRKQYQRQPGPGDYNYQLRGSKSVSSCFASASDRFGRAKSIKQVKAPGPGSYNTNPTQKATFNKSNEGYFNSKTSRFEKDNLNGVGPGSYFNNNGRKKSHSVAQMKRVPNRQEEDLLYKTVKRTTIFETKDKNPGPGQYKNNYGGISYQLHKMLLRKQTTDVMPREERRVFQTKQTIENPGPGAYATHQKKSKQPQGKLYKKAEVVNLKQERQPSPSPADYSNNNHTIEQKIKFMNSKLTLTDQKPFNSGAERFKHYPKTNYGTFNQQDTESSLPKDTGDETLRDGDKKVKRLVMTMIKVRVPFGMSSNKYEDKPAHAYDGPDFYQKSKDWIKPTFNIKGKIQ